MKDFLKYTLATIVGIFVFTIVAWAFGLMSIIGMVAASDATTEVKDNSVLVLNLSGIMEERAQDDPLGSLLGNIASKSGLDDMLSAIKKAKTNDKIKGIYIEGGMFSPDSYASLQALRRELADFKKSGKWIVAYADIYTQGVYYIASVANKVWINPQGMIEWHGLASQPIFYKDVMSKFGVKMQVAKVGKYKSMPEMYTADKMSDSNRAQVKAYIDGIWSNVCKDVASSRKVSVAQLNNVADGLAMFDDPKNYLKEGLVDKYLYADEVKGEIKKMLKLSDDDDINRLSVADMSTVEGEKKKGDEIAVYYAYGSVVDGKQGGDAISGGNAVIDAQVVCRDIEALMDDDDVKAVVLRVNTGGGSAYASEQIWHSLKKLRAKKPLVVSMGGMAASGGYYISSIANWIVAEPTTLTGSIGIFGMFPDFSGLLTQKLGVKFDEVKTNRNSGFGTMARPFNQEEMAYLTAYVERGYSLFLSRVAEGRKMSVAKVDEVAQGHVWLGQDAIKVHLVDELGGLDQAVAKAAKLAKLDEYHTHPYPAKTDWIDSLLGSISKKNYLDGQMRMTLGEYYEPFMLMRNINNTDAIQARIPFEMNIK